MFIYSKRKLIDQIAVVHTVACRQWGEQGSGHRHPSDNSTRGGFLISGVHRGDGRGSWHGHRPDLYVKICIQSEDYYRKTTMDGTVGVI